MAPGDLTLRQCPTALGAVLDLRKIRLGAEMVFARLGIPPLSQDEENVSANPLSVGAKESSISRERAKRILDQGGKPDLYDPTGAYWVVTQSGEEHLVQYGIDAPLATNRTTMSWLGS